jgi:hypothetical protein
MVRQTLQRSWRSDDDEEAGWTESIRSASGGKELPATKCAPARWDGAPILMAAPVTTTTTLAVTANGLSVSSVDASAVVTLTATVKSGSGTVTLGQVNFCDATAKLCSDIHLLGTAPLTTTGTAALKFVPRAGSPQLQSRVCEYRK